MAGALLPCRQLVDDGGLCLDVGQGGVELIDGLVAADEVGGGLFADARHAPNVVGAVAHEGLQVNEALGGEAVFFTEGDGIHVVGHGLSRLGGDKHDAGMVGDELEGVTVARDDDAVPALCLAAAGDGADEVVGLVAHHVVAGDVHGGEDIVQKGHLLMEFLGHTVAVGLVALVRLVAEGGLVAVEGDADGIGLFPVEEALQNVHKAEQCVGVQAFTGGEGTHTVKGAVNDAVAV